MQNVPDLPHFQSLCPYPAACLAIDRLKDFLHSKWFEDFLRCLVSTKRNSGGINLSTTVANGMPKKEGAEKGNVLLGSALLETKNSLKSGISSRFWLQQPHQWFSATLCVPKRQALLQQSLNLFQSVQTQYAPSEVFVGPTVSNQCGPNAIFPTSFTSPQQPQFYVQPPSTL